MIIILSATGLVPRGNEGGWRDYIQNSGPSLKTDTGEGV